MVVTFAIDTTTLTNQPTTIEVKTAEGIVEQTVDGGFVGFVRTKGAVITVTWGVDVSVAAAIAELRTARNSKMAHAISWTDPNGASQSFNVLWKQDPPYQINPAYQVSRFTIIFEERG